MKAIRLRKILEMLPDDTEILICTTSDARDIRQLDKAIINEIDTICGRKYSEVILSTNQADN